MLSCDEGYVMKNQDTCMETYTGKLFHFTDPSLDMIDIVDIAHHLSMLCRFTGACHKFYSVAEHSVRVSRIVPRELKLEALLHDAHEAYTGDINTPLKSMLSMPVIGGIGLTVAIDRLISEKYGIEHSQLSFALVHEADRILLATEVRDLMAPTVKGAWDSALTDQLGFPYKPLADTIEPLTAKQAEIAFIMEFSLFGGKCESSVG